MQILGATEIDYLETLSDETHANFDEGRLDDDEPAAPGARSRGWRWPATCARCTRNGSRLSWVLPRSPTSTLSDEDARRSVEAFIGLNPACVVVTKGLEVPRLLLDVADRNGVPVLRTPLVSSAAIDAIQKHLELQLAPDSEHPRRAHGRAWCGRAAARQERHRQVRGRARPDHARPPPGSAGGLVEVRRTSGDVLVGWASELIKHHMEVRGLGIINIKDMFGVAAVRDEKKIELVLELLRWDQSDSHDRLGLDEMVYPILDVPVPLLRIPVSPGRNVSSLIEVAARNRLLQVRGHHSAREFQERLDRASPMLASAGWKDDVE